MGQLMHEWFVGQLLAPITPLHPFAQVPPRSFEPSPATAQKGSDRAVWGGGEQRMELS